MSDPPDIAAAIVAARGGDHRAFAVLVDRYQGEVRACLAVRLERVADADDLAQEAFLVAYRRLADFDDAHPFGAWLRGIALNLARNHRRRQRERAVGGSAELEVLAEGAVEAALAAGGEATLAERLERCLERLSGRERELIDLRYGRDLPLAAVGERCGLRHSAVTMALHRARERLRLCLGLGPAATAEAGHG